MIENRVMILTVVCWSFVSPLPHWCSEYECSRCGFCERGRRSLQATARAAAPNNRPVGDKRRRPCVALSLRLDWLPSRRQYLISMGTGIENHVVYLSLERLCLQAVGRESLLPRERYAALCEFEIVLHALFGGVCT